MDSLKIEPRGGQVIDVDRSDLSKGVIFFKDAKPELPKTWEELGTVSGYYVDACSGIIEVGDLMIKGLRKNTFPTKELAEAALALAQLLQLRDRYNDGWVPDWCSGSTKFAIWVNRGSIFKKPAFYHSKVLVFKTSELVDQFLENFRDLIEVAKPLI